MLGLFLNIIDLALFLLSGEQSITVQPEYDVNNLDLVQNLFENFMVNYNRSYNDSEKIQRFEYFRQNLGLINLLNNKNPDAVFGKLHFYAVLDLTHLQFLVRTYLLHLKLILCILNQLQN